MWWWVLEEEERDVPQQRVHSLSYVHTGQVVWRSWRRRRGWQTVSSTECCFILNNCNQFVVSLLKMGVR